MNNRALTASRGTPPGQSLFLKADRRENQDLRRPYGVAYLLSTGAWTD
jgi:hypothetical protein